MDKGIDNNNVRDGKSNAVNSDITDAVPQTKGKLQMYVHGRTKVPG
jgi:hypothetical protein